MPLLINGTEVDDFQVNGVSMDSGVINGTEVFTAFVEFNVSNLTDTGDTLQVDYSTTSIDITNSGGEIYGTLATDYMDKHTLSTPNLLTSASTSFFSIANGGDFEGVAFKEDGSKFFVLNDNSNRLELWNTSPLSQIDTDSYFSSSTRGFDVRQDGTYGYWFNEYSDNNYYVSPLSISGGWSMTSSSYTSVGEKNLGSGNWAGFALSKDGFSFIVGNNSNSTIEQWVTPTAFDFSSAVLTHTYTDSYLSNNNILDFTVTADERYLYVLLDDTSTKRIRKYKF